MLNENNLERRIVFLLSVWKRLFVIQTESDRLEKNMYK